MENLLRKIEVNVKAKNLQLGLSLQVKSIPLEMPLEKLPDQHYGIN